MARRGSRHDDEQREEERPVAHLFDGHVLVFRAFHAMPAMPAPDGMATGATYGFARALLRHLERHAASHAAVCFDFALECFRSEIYPPYKAHRGEPPPELEAQFALCQDVAHALGLPVFVQERYEADDLLATLGSRVVRDGGAVRIVTTDKDLAQLVREDGRLVLHDPGKDATVDADGVRARFGVDPEQIPDYLGLVGDAVDNLPGVPGFGAKSAAGALRRFRAIEGIPDDPSQWRDCAVRGAARLAGSLARHREQALRVRSLATVERAVPGVEAGLHEMRLRGAPRDLALPLFERLGWQGMAARIPRWLG